MTWVLCDDWSPTSPGDSPCINFTFSNHNFAGPDIGNYLDWVAIVCADHPNGSITYHEDADEWQDAVDEQFRDAGFVLCGICGDRDYGYDAHFRAHRDCADYLNDEHDSWTSFMGDELEDAERWRAILAGHEIEPHPALERYIAAFEDEDEDEEEVVAIVEQRANELVAERRQRFARELATLEPNTWRDAEGTVHLVGTMTQEHLANVISYCAGRSVAPPIWIINAYRARFPGSQQMTAQEYVRSYRGMLWHEILADTAEPARPTPAPTIRELWLRRTA